MEEEFYIGIDVVNTLELKGALDEKGNSIDTYAHMVRNPKPHLRESGWALIAKDHMESRDIIDQRIRAMIGDISTDNPNIRGIAYLGAIDQYTRIFTRFVDAEAPYVKRGDTISRIYIPHTITALVPSLKFLISVKGISVERGLVEYFLKK